MPKLLLTWLALIGLTLSAQAQVPMTGAGASAPAAVVSSATFTATDSKINETAGFVTSVTFTGVNVTTGLVVVSAWAYLGGFTGDFSAVSVNGTGLTKTASLGNVGGPAAMWQGNVTGGSVSVVLTSSVAASIANIAFSIGTLTTTNPIATGSSSINTNQLSPYSYGSITIPTNGIAVCGLRFGFTTAITWTNMTNLPAGRAVGAAGETSMSYNSTPQTLSPTFTGQNFSDASGICAAWGP